MNAVAYPLSVSVVQRLDEWVEAQALRAIVYIGEQDYSFAQEFDGGDLCGATHFLARRGGEPVGACRIRWFADFAKLERMAVKRAHRARGVSQALWERASELAARKGYKVFLGHIEQGLLPFWNRVAGFVPREGRPSYHLHGRDFFEAIAPLPRHPDAIRLDAPADLVLASDADLAIVPVRRKAS